MLETPAGLRTQTPGNAASAANVHIEWDFRLVCWQIDLSFAESSTQGLKRWVERDACVAFYPVASKAEREREPEYSTVS
jgi:hypothetical protein